jgi:hypothetical protein
MGAKIPPNSNQPPVPAGEGPGTHRCCANCVYGTCSMHMKLSGFLTGFGRRPLCANHPDTPGRLRPVRAGGLCRNYRPKPPAPAQPQESVRRINLAHGGFVLVDAADFEWLNQYQWTARGTGGYATRVEKGKMIFMHREIVNAPKGTVVDHHDRNKQNNCRSNLRICDRRQNVCNQVKHLGCISQFKGVHFNKLCRKWYAEAFLAGEPFKTGFCADEVKAARAYDRLAVELFGEFAYLNFPEDWPPEKRQEAFAKKEMVQALRKKRAEKARKREENRRKAEGKSRTAKGKSKKGKGKTRRQ